jgi:hypothetical protein
MNELHFAYKVRQHLNLGLRELGPETASRLAAAREKALSCQRQTVNQSILATAGSFVHHQLDNQRLKQILATLALLLCVVFSSFWMADQRINEQSDVDSALLADDLPIGAYTDKGFDAWLRSTTPQ